MRLLKNRIGLRVDLQLVDEVAAMGRSAPWHKGTIVGRKRAWGRRKIVVIRLDDGKKIRGWDCWWGAAEPDPVGYWHLPTRAGMIEVYQSIQEEMLAANEDSAA